MDIEPLKELSISAVQSSYGVIVASLVKTVVPDMISKTYHSLKEKYKENNKEIESYYEEYLNNSLETVGYVKTIYNRNKPSKIESIFVPMKLCHNTSNYSSDDIGSLLSIVPPFVQINGVGGIGKTTTLKYMFIKVLRQNYFIPIYIELKRLNNSDSVPDILDFIYESMTKYGFKMEKTDFVETLYTGKYVFFIDGFDEIKLNHQSLVFQKLQDMRTKYKNNHFFVASRSIETMQSGWQTSTILNIEPLKKNQSIQMIQKIDDFDKEILGRFIHELSDDNFYSKYQEFVSNPLLLSIMLITYNQFAELPEKLHLFYDKAFSTLYSEHDASKGGFVRDKRMEMNGVTSDEFEKIICSLSIASYVDKKNTFENKHELLKYIEKSKKYGEFINNVSFNSNDLIYDLVDAICLLVKDGDEYKFIHRSFQEYFVSNYIELLSDDKQEELLINLFNRDEEIFYSDEFFSMLYDKNSVRINKNFFAVLLTRFSEKTKLENELESILSYFSYENPYLFNRICQDIEEFVYTNISLLAKKGKHHNEGKKVKGLLVKQNFKKEKYIIENEIDLALVLENYLKRNIIDIKEVSEKDFTELYLKLIKNQIELYSNNEYDETKLISDKKFREAIQKQAVFKSAKKEFILIGNKYRLLLEIKDEIEKLNSNRFDFLFAK